MILTGAVHWNNRVYTTDDLDDLLADTKAAGADGKNVIEHLKAKGTLVSPKPAPKKKAVKGGQEPPKPVADEA